MKNLRKVLSILLILLLTLSTASFAAVAETATIYVSSVGSANGDGTAESPFATLAQAKDYVQTMDKTGGVEVVFESGEYFFADKVTFTAEDSGVEGAPVTYRAEEGADVVFTGAVALNKDFFSKVEDAAILKKLPASSRSKVLMLDLTKQGITISETYPALYVNDTQATIARYPNEGFLVADGATGATSFDIANAANWDITETDDVTLVGSLNNGYVWTSAKVESVSDATVTLGKTIRKNAYYFVRNIIEELDAPGEYIIKDNILYYYPTDDFANLDMEIATYSDSSIIEINGAENITFDGITFEKSNSQAITTADKYTNCISITNCNFKYIIDDVLDIRGYDHVISDNYAYGCGSRFIEFRGGEKANLKPGNILITKNRIVACGNWNPSVGGTIKGGVDSSQDFICIGNEVSHNIIQDCNTSSAINVTGNDNIIKYNEIINQGRIIEDGGAIYAGRAATKYGTVVSHNYIHDFNLENDYSALYPDDGMSGITMEYNVIARVSKAMVSGLGANNKLTNNLLIDVSKGFGLGTRMTWGAVYEAGGSLYKEAYGIVYNDNKEISKAYNDKYPEITEQVDNHIKKGYPFFAPWNTLVTGNVLISDNTSLTTIASTPSHKYTTTTFGSTLTIPGEDKLGSSLKTFYSGSTKYVDEIATYGDKDANAAGINATAAGNPRFTKKEVEGKLSGDMVTAKVSDVSDVHNIEMSNIGVLSSTNDNVLKNNPETIKLTAVAVDNAKAVITWEAVEKASEYNIIISKNANLSSPIVNENYYSVFGSNNYTAELDAGTYYYQVTAKGLNRESGFAIESEVGQFVVDSLYKANFKNALSIAEEVIKGAKKGSIAVKGDEELAALEEGYTAKLPIHNSAATQTDLDTAEAELYTLIEAAAPAAASEITVTRFEADQKSTIVYVEANGLPANTLTTVTVTNPGVTFANATTNFGMENIRFVSAVVSDNLGRIAVEFDTSKDEIDYTGVYKLYIKPDKAEMVEKEYTYGTVELSDVTFKNGEDVISKDNLANFAGEEITLTMSVKNRTTRVLKPEVYLGVYASGALKNAFLEKSTSIQPNSDGTVSMTVTVPSDYTSETEFKLFVWDDLELLRPLTKTRFIYK